MTPTCPQALPGWITTAQEFTTGRPITDHRNYTVNDVPPVDPRASEDCLFVDVLASSAVYERTKTVPELPCSSGSTAVALRADGRRRLAMARILCH